MDPEVRYDYCDIPKCENAETDTDSSSVSNDSYDDWIVQDDYEYSIDWHALLGEIFGGEMSEGNPFDADYEAYDYNNTDFEEYREDYNEQNNCQSLHLSEPGSDYNGTVSETSSGRKCRNWSQIDGFEHYGDHNYCRNLGFSANDAPGGIWCYTTDTEVRWEYCDQVKICQEETSDISVSPGTCGVSAVDVVWGREARLAGLPSKLTSRGKLLTPRRRNRRASRHNRSRKPMTWMEMIKEYRNNPQPETRIMGGNPADEKVWPWQVAFRLRDNGKLFCGGSLISSKYVLSAAHCFEQVRSRHVFVTAGHVSKGYQRAGREPGFQQYALEKLIPHEAYDNNIIYTDIALAKIHGEWQMTEYVRPACLPESSFSTSDSAVCVITGWGKTDGNKDLLNQATMPVINFQRCRRLLDYAVKDHTQFCAGVVDKGGVDTCQGDSGGPLMCNSGGVWKVVGITSWGYGCGEKNSPGVYTAVAKYRQWINYWLER
jgi:V8-like Glu-specific endopeptidase